MATTVHTSALGKVKLRRNKGDGSLTYVLAGGHQSAVDRHGRSLDTYIHAIYGLIMQRAPEPRGKTVLMIGCGGGTLGSMLRAAGMKVTIVDIDPTAFALAKSHFGLPDGVTCRVGDGLEFLKRTRRRYDVLISDAFIGERTPKHLTGDDFCAAARRCLMPEGMLFINVCLFRRNDPTADRFATRLKTHGLPVRLLDQRGAARNAVIVAGNVRGLRAPALLLPPATERARVRRELKGSRFRPLRKE